MDSKHGGSPQSGIVPPAGIEQHTEMSEGGIIVPEIHREAEKRKERARQLERRRIALELLPGAIRASGDILDPVRVALSHADELIRLTGGEF